MANQDNASLDQVIDTMLTFLKKYLPQPLAGLPDPEVSVVGVRERAVGLSNYIGMDTLAGFPAVTRKGIRLDALVRFQMWSTDPAEIDALITNLDTQLMADRDRLRKNGFLLLSLENSLASDMIFAINAWRRQANYHVLYEYRFQDTDGAESLIARIQVDSTSNGSIAPEKETTFVTDQMIRWDNTAAQQFVLRGPFYVGGLEALVFVPRAEPGGAITVTRTADGLSGQPVVRATWQDFLAAVAGPNTPDRHSRVTFPSLQDFLDNFSSAGDAIVLGDWDADNVPDSYEPLFLSINPAIQLPTVLDRLEITCQNNIFDQVAVLYMRATTG